MTSHDDDYPTLVVLRRNLFATRCGRCGAVCGEQRAGSIHDRPMQCDIAAEAVGWYVWRSKDRETALCPGCREEGP